MDNDIGALYSAAKSISTFPHKDPNLKLQSRQSIEILIKRLDSEIEKQPQNANLLSYRGRSKRFRLILLQPCEEYDEIYLQFLADFEKACKLNPENVDNLVRLVSAKLSYSQSLQDRLEISHNDSIMVQSLSATWRDLADIARQILAIKSNTKVQKIKALRALCHSLLALSEHEDIEKHVEDWITSAKGTKYISDALHFKGKICRELGDTESALNHWEASLAADPTHLPSLTSKATLFRDLGKFEDAITIWNDLISKEPDRVEFLYRSAGDYLMSGNPKESSIRLKRCLELDENLACAINDLAYLNITESNWAEAGKLLTKVLALGPTDDIPWINMANVLYHLKDYEQALRSITQAKAAVRSGSRRRTAEEHLIHAAILRAMESNDSSLIVCFLDALKAEDLVEKAQAHFEYADYLLSKGSQSAAEVHIQSAIKLQPSFSIDQLNLTKLELQPSTVETFKRLKN